MSNYREQAERLKIDILRERILWEEDRPLLKIDLRVTLDGKTLYQKLRANYPNIGFMNLNTWGFDRHPSFRDKIVEFLNTRLNELLKKEKTPKINQYDIIWEAWKEFNAVHVDFKVEGNDTSYFIVLEDIADTWKCKLIAKINNVSDKFHFPSVLWCDQIYDQAVELVNGSDKFRVRNIVQPRKKEYMMPLYNKKNS